MRMTDEQKIGYEEALIKDKAVLMQLESVLADSDNRFCREIIGREIVAFRSIARMARLDDTSYKEHSRICREEREIMRKELDELILTKGDK